MSSKFKIAILGIGGVGGYIGGKFAKAFTNSEEAEIIFLARGDTEKAIKANGLQLITPSGKSIVYPSKITSHAEEIGLVDLVICCTKNYNLEESIYSLRPCIAGNTIFLPLLNGVDASERIKNIFPENIVFDGCIYLVSRIITPGIIQQFGTVDQLFWGLSKEKKFDKITLVEYLFKKAGINASFTYDIQQTCWEKFFFVSTIATLTSYLDKPIGEILNNVDLKEKLIALMNELKSIADSKNITLPPAIIQKTLDKMASLPSDTTSSMQLDFKNGNRTELASLTAYVITLGKELNIATPGYNDIYLNLVNRS